MTTDSRAKTAKADGAARMRAFAFLFAFLLLFSLCAATAQASTATPGCDDQLWNDMQHHADAMRVQNAGYGRAMRQPSSALTATCFDLALGLSTRLGAMFGDIAGGLRAAANLPPLSAWASVVANFSAGISMGRANPAFFPPEATVQPPMAALINGAAGALDIGVNAKMKLYNPFAGLGVKLDFSSSIPKVMPDSLAAFLSDAFQTDLANNVANFKFSIDYQLGVRATYALKCMIHLINLDPNLPTIPRLDLPMPDLGTSFDICGFSIGAGDIASALGYDLGPIVTLMQTLQEYMRSVNKYVDMYNNFNTKLKSIAGRLQELVTDFNSAANISGSANYSLSGSTWRDLSRALPSLAPGCLVGMAIWAGQHYNQATQKIEAAVDSAGKTIQGIAGGGPYGNVPLDASNKPVNASASDLPYFTYDDLVASVHQGTSGSIEGLGQGIAGAGAELTGDGGVSFACTTPGAVGCIDISGSASAGLGGSASGGASGGTTVSAGPLASISCSASVNVNVNVSANVSASAKIKGELLNMSNAKYLLKASLDLKNHLAKPGQLPCWQPPPTTAMPSSCAVVAQMPGTENTSNCK
jgi:hypothetical protein